MWIISFPSDYLNTKLLGVNLNLWQNSVYFCFSRATDEFRIIFGEWEYIFIMTCFRQFFEMMTALDIVSSEICFRWKPYENLLNHDVYYGNRYWIFLLYCRLLIKHRSWWGILRHSLWVTNIIELTVSGAVIVQGKGDLVEVATFSDNYIVDRKIISYRQFFLFFCVV